MDTSEAPQFTLAIESAIAGGSLSLLDGTGRERANWVGGNADVARAEDLLANIDDLLSSASVSKQDLALIAVSAGPGSFTGIRIGIATALGLKTGLGIPMSSVSSLEAICRAAGSLRSDITVAVPVGRNSICVQRFQDGTAVDAPTTVPESGFVELLENGQTFVLHHALFQEYDRLQNVIDFGANVAYAVGRAASPGVVTEPLFVSKSF